MPRLGLGLGLNLPRPVFFYGSNIPQMPIIGLEGYYTAYDIDLMGFSSGVLINSLGSSSVSGADITQATPAENPSFVEGISPHKRRIAFDGNDDNLTGIATQAGDFTYVFKLAFDTLATTNYLLTDSGGSSALVLLSDNYMYLRDTTGANDIVLNNYSVTNEDTVYAIVRDVDSVRFYVNSILTQTVDVTGRTFTFDTLGASADSMDSQFEYLAPYNVVLSQEEIEYFSYVRNDDTNQIILVDGLPIIVS